MRFPSRVETLFGYICFSMMVTLALAGCASESAKEQRELRSLEAAIGLLANATSDDRAARLEQLQDLAIETERVVTLKRLCLSSYQSFERASALLASAKRETADVESEIVKAYQKKNGGGTLSADEEARLRSLEAKASASVKKVTRELDLAEGYVAACEHKRKALREEILSP